jgi:HK97 family phage major capsid protein
VAEETIQVPLTKEEIRDMIKEALGKEVTEMMAASEAKGKETLGSARQAQTPDTYAQVGTLDEKSIRSVRPSGRSTNTAKILRATAVAKLGYGSPEHVLQGWADKNRAYGEAYEIVKGLSSETIGGGGGLVDIPVAEEILPALEAKSVVRRMRANVGPLSVYNRESTAASVGWVGETGTRQESAMAFDQLAMSPKHIYVMVAVSNYLIDKADPRVDTFVQMRLEQRLAIGQDLKFLRGVGTQHAPKGIRYWTHADNIITANATVNTANTIADLIKIKDAVESADVDVERGGWIFAPRTHNYLLQLTDANSNFVFREELAGGTLMGYPFAPTTQIPTNLSTDKTEVYYGDFAKVVIGEDTDLRVDAERGVAYTNSSGTLVSAFDQNETIIKVEQAVDFVQLYDKAFGILDQAQWTL